MTHPRQFTLRRLFYAITVVAIVIAIVSGIWRLTRHVIFNAERTYWTEAVRDGRVDDPHKSPAATFLTSDEIDDLLEERAAMQKNLSP